MLAASIVALGAVLGAPAPAQPPGSAPRNQPTPPQGYLPPVKGYVTRTPPPQHQPPAPSSGGGGRVMYFQKPADALTATGGPGSSAGGVAQLSEPVRDPNVVPVPAPVPDVSSTALPPLPPPPASRYPDPAVRVPATNPALVIPPAQTQPEPGAVRYSQPFDPFRVDKKDVKIPEVDPKYTQLPRRESIFMAYDDLDLERAIIEKMTQDRITALIAQIAKSKVELELEADPKRREELRDRIAKDEELIKTLRAIKNPLTEAGYRFPALPVVSPPGVAYQPKTVHYEPRQLLVEPGYVIHRRLHFEEKNGERAGWDLGPFSTLVATTHFCRDAILWPQSLVSGCVHGFWDTSAGKCLPGSPSPYYLYPPGLTLSGSIAEAGIIIGTAAIFP